MHFEIRPRDVLVYSACTVTLDLRNYNDGNTSVCYQ